MADRADFRGDDAFAAETRRIMARRAPLGLGFVLGLAGVAGALELAYYPDRLSRLAAAFGVEALLCTGALLATRRASLRRLVVPIVSAASLAVAVFMTLYVA